MDSITAILEGFHDHLSQRSSTALKLVYVVIDRDEILKAFQQGLNQWTPKPQVENIYIHCVAESMWTHDYHTHVWFLPE